MTALGVLGQYFSESTQSYAPFHVLFARVHISIACHAHVAAASGYEISITHVNASLTLPTFVLAIPTQSSSNSKGHSRSSTAMADTEDAVKPGGHYSGKNKIPTVNQFLERLDKDKKERDQQIDQERKQNKSHASQQNGEAVPHKEQELAVKGSQKKVKDPTTGREVVIEDVNDQTMETAKNPVV